MARVKIEEIIDRLDSEMARALKDVFDKHAPGVTINPRQVARDFSRAVGRRCSTWESIPDQYVEKS